MATKHISGTMLRFTLKDGKAVKAEVIA